MEQRKISLTSDAFSPAQTIQTSYQNYYGGQSTLGGNQN